MPTEISDGAGVPHASDYSDLLDKLRTFALSTGFWTSLQHDSEMTCLQGEGAGSDEIIVAFKKYADVPSDSYGLYINGYTGYSSGLTFLNQPGALPLGNASATAPGYRAMPLWNSTIPYWFIVNERRIIVVAKISTIYHYAYAGFILPYASPNQYPYPLAIGGSACPVAVTPRPRFSSTDNSTHAFWRGSNGGSSVPCTLDVKLPGGVWRSQDNSQAALSLAYTSYPSNLRHQGLYPYSHDVGGNDTSSYIDNVRDTIDGQPVLTPIEWSYDQSDLDQGSIGEIDGVFHVTGSGRSAEDIITIGADDYLVVQDVFRTDIDRYAAIKLD